MLAFADEADLLRWVKALVQVPPLLSPIDSWAILWAIQVLYSERCLAVCKNRPSIANIRIVEPLNCLTDWHTESPSDDPHSKCVLGACL